MGPIQDIDRVDLQAAGVRHEARQRPSRQRARTIQVLPLQEQTGDGGLGQPFHGGDSTT